MTTTIGHMYTVRLSPLRAAIDPASLDTKKATSYIELTGPNSKVFKISGHPRRKEGINIDVAVIDECHELKDTPQFKPIEQSTERKGEPKIIFITTGRLW